MTSNMDISPVFSKEKEQHDQTNGFTGLQGELAEHIFLRQFKNDVERVLHVKGNYNGGILEMAVILDYCLAKEAIQKTVPMLLRSLKMHSEVFRNVRLNVVDWKSDTEIENRVSPMSMVMLESYYEDYKQLERKKNLAPLTEYLKLFQARAKLIILVTDGSYTVENEIELKKTMQPFLEKKFMQVFITEDGMRTVYR